MSQSVKKQHKAEREYRVCPHYKGRHRVPLEVCKANADAGKKNCVSCMKEWSQPELIALPKTKKKRRGRDSAGD
jgi:hypothetical protein